MRSPSLGFRSFEVTIQHGTCTGLSVRTSPFLTASVFVALKVGSACSLSQNWSSIPVSDLEPESEMASVSRYHLPVESVF